MADSTKVFPPGFRAEDDNGIIIAGGTLEFFFAGTSDPMTVHSDKERTVSLGTTVGLNGGGYPVSSGGTRVIVYAGTDPYRVRLKDDDDVVVWEHDNVQGALDTGDFEDVITAQLPAGTVQIFGQTNAPPGWTKSVAHDDALPRLVSGSAASGGANGVSVVFADRTLTRANLSNATLSGNTGNNTNMDLKITTQGYWNSTSHTNVVTGVSLGANNTSSADRSLIVSTAHTHAFTTSSINGGVTQTVVQFDPKYVDFIIATKD